MKGNFFESLYNQTQEQENKIRGAMARKAKRRDLQKQSFTQNPQLQQKSKYIGYESSIPNYISNYQSHTAKNNLSINFSNTPLFQSSLKKQQIQNNKNKTIESTQFDKKKNINEVLMKIQNQTDDKNIYGEYKKQKKTFSQYTQQFDSVITANEQLKKYNQLQVIYLKTKGELANAHSKIDELTVLLQNKQQFIQTYQAINQSHSQFQQELKKSNNLLLIQKQENQKLIQQIELIKMKYENNIWEQKDKKKQNSIKQIVEKMYLLINQNIILKEQIDKINKQK